MDGMKVRRSRRVQWMVDNAILWEDFPTTKNEVINDTYWRNKNWFLVHLMKGEGLVSQKTFHEDVNVADLAIQARKIISEKLIEHDVSC